MKKVKRKPHWPKWANYKATDKNTISFFYAVKPYLVPDFGWDGEPNCKCCLHKTKKNYKGNWKKSLRKIED